MQPTLSFLSVLAFVSVASAQNASFSLLVPQTAQINVGSQLQTTTLPSGPLANAGTLEAVVATATDIARVSVDWGIQSWSTGMQANFGHSVYAPGPSPASASVTSSDYLLLLSNPTPIDVELRLSRLIAALSGPPLQSLQVDVGNDGSIELSESSNTNTVVMTLVLGPVPTPVRFRNQVSSTMSLFTQITVDVTPTSRIFIVPAILGCNVGHQQVAFPNFDNGLELRTVGPLLASQPTVGILGLGVQPIVLPSAQTFPCLLLPTPDLLVFLPVGQAFTLLLPAAVRPITFWTQAVVLDPMGLQTTNGFQVSAY
jgi:hypothetical protein